jgi:hypothetical protein
MKLLLTSAGVRNPSIRSALDDLLQRSVADCTALCIPTALYGHPAVGPGTNARNFITGETDHMTGLGWKSVGVLELTDLPLPDPVRLTPQPGRRVDATKRTPQALFPGSQVAIALEGMKHRIQRPGTERITVTRKLLNHPLPIESPSAA